MAKDAKPMSKKDRIAAAIFACKDKGGHIKPQAVIDAARDPNNDLHDEFEWNTAKLVQQALEARAVELIRSVREYVDLGTRVITAPMYIANPKKIDHSYVTTMSVAKNAGLKRLAMEAELARIKGSLHRALSLALVFRLGSEFQALLDQLLAIEKQFLDA